MLAGVPFTFALDLDPSAVDKQVPRAIPTAMMNVDRKCPLTAADGEEIQHEPV